MPDPSYQERLQQKLLRSKVHQRRNAGEKNLTICKGQIVTLQTNMDTSHSPQHLLPLIMRSLSNISTSVTNLSVKQNKDRSTSCSPLKLLVINCQSLHVKKPSFLNLIIENNPDFIVSTESWLSPKIHSSKIFPSTHTIFRWDRADSYGGVFIACKSTFLCEELALVTSSKVVLCRIHLNNQFIILISAYRPPNNNYEYLDNYS